MTIDINRKETEMDTKTMGNFNYTDYIPLVLMGYGVNWDGFEPEEGRDYWKAILTMNIPSIENSIKRVKEGIDRYIGYETNLKEVIRIGTELQERARKFVQSADSVVVSPDGTTILKLITDENNCFDFDKWFGITCDIGNFVNKICMEFLKEDGKFENDISKIKKGLHWLTAYKNLLEYTLYVHAAMYALEKADRKYKTAILRIALRMLTTCIESSDYLDIPDSEIPEEIKYSMKYNDEMRKRVKDSCEEAQKLYRSLKTVKKNLKIQGDLFWRDFALSKFCEPWNR